MKEAKTYVGAAVFYEREADDGWPEDAGLWPIDGYTSHLANRAEVGVQFDRRHSVFQRLKALLPSSGRGSRMDATQR
jgi:hypothetical protein